MATHVNHHYIPDFLLKTWLSGPDKKLSVFKILPDGRLRHDRLGSRAVAHEAHLYSLRRSESDPDTRIENEFLAKLVDGPAAIAHAQMLKSGLASLTAEQRDDWARFLVAGLVRIPWMIEQFRDIGRRELLTQFESMATHAGRPEAAKTMLQPRFKDVLDDHGMETFVKAIRSEKYVRWVNEAAWSLVTLPAKVESTIIGDAPVSYFGELMENAFALVAPISPRHLFSCTSNAHYHSLLEGMTPKALLKATNKRMVQHAADYVYAVDQAHRPLIERHLGRGRRLLNEQHSKGAGLS
ncbi:DUF4238 domain-containing protein [Variovorax sp. AFSI2.2]|uniref:DUF4238 domain-containing protein n=1 Tax=Variovorax sp. AFSI2.2 TaxID=3384160 RepID=UPI003EBD6675